jgi:hypothetical protein
VPARCACQQQPRKPADSEFSELRIGWCIGLRVKRGGQEDHICPADRTTVMIQKENAMTLIPSLSQDDQPQSKAEDVTQLAALIQEYPAEAQLIMAAVEEGLTLGPAQVMFAAQNHDQQGEAAGSPSSVSPAPGPAGR